MKYCCDSMKYYLNFNCEIHSDVFECPEAMILYDEVFDEYGLIVHDGGRSKIEIQYCPWCGEKLPDSKRDRWIEELKNLGIDSPFEEQVPAIYRTSAWWKINTKMNK